MISYEDCVALCGLTKREIAATTLAQYLLHEEHGPETIFRMIAEDMRAALNRGDVGHAAALMAALRHFCQGHPSARSGQHAHAKN